MDVNSNASLGHRRCRKVASAQTYEPAGLAQSRRWPEESIPSKECRGVSVNDAVYFEYVLFLICSCYIFHPITMPLMPFTLVIPLHRLGNQERPESLCRPESRPRTMVSQHLVVLAGRFVSFPGDAL